MTMRTSSRRLARIALMLVAGATILSAESSAQTRQGKTRSAAATSRTTTENVANPLQGFSQNRGQPIHIEAATLEVRDKDQTAKFIGNVHVVQGDTDLRCDTLTVYYEQGKQTNTKSATSGTKRGQPQPQSMEQQQIRRLEVNGNVVVVQKEQMATGDSGVFDLRSNIVTLSGNVIVNQGKHVLRGDRLVVNMDSGISRMESNSGRVQGLFQPSQQKNGSPPSATRLIPSLR